MPTRLRTATMLVLLATKVMAAISVVVLICTLGCGQAPKSSSKPDIKEAPKAEEKEGDTSRSFGEDPMAKADAERDGHQVTVLYGTCREVVLEPLPWSGHFRAFVWTTYGLLTVVALVLVVLATIVYLGFRHRLRILRVATVIACCVLFYAVAAALDASYRTRLDRSVEGMYGNLRGDLRYGLATVSVPEHHERGKLESPFSFYVVRMPEDPEKHFVVQKLEEDRERFFEELSKRVQGSQGKEAFVFIHGYNVSFGDAVKRTAQLAVDLKFSGAPICFTWPSKADLKSYVADINHAKVAQDELKKFLTEIEAQSGAKTIHLVAHSMGTSILTEALKEMDRTQLERSVFREILLAAPDIDADYFKKDIVPALSNDRQHITLYASTNDKALNVSAALNSAPRAGMAGEHLLVLDKIDTIDVSALDTDFFGHSTYGDHILAVKDICDLLTRGLRPPDRGLQEREKNGLHYWVFVRPKQ